MRAFYLLFAFLLFACGKDGAKAPTPPGAPSAGPGSNAMSAQPEVLSKAAGEQLLRTDVIRCGEANAADCPSAVGLLLMKLPDGSFSQCTTFLVAPDVAVTNSHCIPEDLKAAGSSCRDRGWLAFPALPGAHADQAACAEVLTASPLPAKGMTRDYAVLHLASPVIGRAPLAISREGLPEHAPVRLAKVNPAAASDQPSLLRVIHCKAVHGSSLIPDSNDDLADNMILGDCAVVHGNSGSPILAEDGKVRGVIQATYDAKELNGQITANKLALFDGPLAALGGATNFACLAFPSAVPAPPLPLTCATRVPGDDFAKTLTDKANALLQAKFEASDGALPPAFGWTTQEQDETKPGGRSMLAVPACVADSSALSGGPMSAALPNVELLSGADRYFVQDVRVNALDPVAATIQATAGGAVELRRASAGGEVLFSKTLEPCGN